MLSPDIRPNQPPQKETTWYFVDRPKRNDKFPPNAQTRGLISLIETSWERLSIQAYDSLVRQSDAVLKPDLLTADTKDDKFRFTLYDISTQIVTIGLPVDIRSVFNFFQIGEKLHPKKNEALSGQKPYRVSREELFQIFISVLAILELNPVRKIKESNIKKIGRIKKKIKAKGSNRLVPEIEQILREETQVSPTLGKEIFPTPQQQKKIPVVTEKPDSDIQRLIIFGTNQTPKIEYRKRPPITVFETKEEIDRLMRRKPERGGPMMNVR